jgi:PAS domain S-box-containing protein
MEPNHVSELQQLSGRRAGVGQAQDPGGRLSLALHAAKLGDWSWDAETDMVTMSERAAQIFGIPPGPHMTWQRMRELLHPDDRERAREAVERSIAEHNDYDIEYRLLRESGELAWVLARGRAIYDPSGTVTGMIGVVQDVTVRKALESDLHARTQALETVYNLGIAIGAEQDVHKVVQAVTDAATQLTGAHFGAFFYNVLDGHGGSYMLYCLSGVDPSHFAGFPQPRATALFGPTFRGEGVIRLANVRKDPRYGTFAPHHGMPKGHLPVVSYLAVPVISRSGEVLGGLFFGHPSEGVFNESHEQIVSSLAAQAAVAIDNSRLHERAQRSLAAAEMANRVKDEFLATVSHELRTPLTAIVGWVHLLRTGTLTAADQARAIDTVERSVNAQRRIIDDILDVSRIISGKLRLELVPVDLVSSVEAATESLRPLIDSRQINLVRLFESALLVLGDAGRLQQVAWNLVSNAIKYSPRGGRVTVSARRVGSSAELCVSDNGEGIDPAFLPHVFDRFRQADSSTTRQHGGIGLGLSIVRHLTELHGGTVEARSEGLGKGSTFVVRIPLSSVAATVPETTSARAEASIAEPTAGALPDLKGVRVLVVDDEHDTRVVLTTILSRAGSQVITAASADEALSVVDSSPPDVIVSDIGMPGEDGYSFMRRLRARQAQEGGAIPAAALTAYARAEDRLRCLAAGFHTHVAKPVTPIELVTAVASLAGRSGK